VIVPPNVDRFCKACQAAGLYGTSLDTSIVYTDALQHPTTMTPASFTFSATPITKNFYNLELSLIRARSYLSIALRRPVLA